MESEISPSDVGRKNALAIRTPDPGPFPMNPTFVGVES
jgi:hypothetical protein